MERYTLRTTQMDLDTNFVEACWPITDRPDFPEHDELRWDEVYTIEAKRDGETVATIEIEVEEN